MIIPLAAALTLQLTELPDASWLKGCWEGEGLGARVTECWMQAPDGRMTGMFQLLDPDGAQRFSEIFVLDRFDTGVELRLKHFNPDMTGWETQEDYLDWTLVEAGERSLVFNGLEMSLDEADRLIVLLDMRRNGEVVRERFTFERME